MGETVATSTCEAEVNATTAAAKNAIHLKNLFVELEQMPKMLQFASLKIILLQFCLIHHFTSDQM
jgi:hypothetical protein